MHYIRLDCQHESFHLTDSQRTRRPTQPEHRLYDELIKYNQFARSSESSVESLLQPSLRCSSFMFPQGFINSF
ncbi:Protein of unknown function, partial [Gryllus bimaculatus]